MKANKQKMAIYFVSAFIVLVLILSIILIPRFSTQKENNLLKSLIGINSKYLVNDYWYSNQQYAFNKSSNTNRQEMLTEEQQEKINEGIVSFKNWRDTQYLDIINWKGNSEQAIRPWAHYSFALSVMLKYDLLDKSISKQDATLMECKLISSLAKYHCANTKNGWGGTWQSALWAENIGFASWLMWDNLSNEDQNNVNRMIVYEANRFIDYKVPYYKDRQGNVIYKGDTKAEENAWNSRILALAVCMFPDNENVNKWEQKLFELLLSSTSTPEDVFSDEQIDGVVLSDILNGSNINSDGSVINHGLYHIDYSATTIEGMTDCIIIYSLAGRKIPQSAIHNLDLMYDALVNLDLGKYEAAKAGHHFFERDSEGNPTFEINMPGDNDWGGHWYGSYYLVDTVCDAFNMDNTCENGLKAKDWAYQHLSKIANMLNDTSNGKALGSFFQEGENYFVSGEMYQSHNLCKAWLIKNLIKQ